jgi:hypothetical protein
VFGSPDATDTTEAIVGANLERLLIASDIVGVDRVFRSDGDGDGVGDACDDCVNARTHARIEPCARYDVDGIGATLTASDWSRARAAFGSDAGPRCRLCPLRDPLFRCLGPACRPR